MIWGEVELAYAYGKGDVLAITGNEWKDNNNKPFRRNHGTCWKESVFVVGNIGNPYTQGAVSEMTDDSV